MEEYIKILEEIEEIYRSCSVNEEGFDIGFTKKECEALVNLFIPKSKVKEKIEELKNGTYDAKIILQKLLKD